MTGGTGTALASDTSFTVSLDDDNDGSESFQILNGADATVFEVEETGNINGRSGSEKETLRLWAGSTPAPLNYLTPKIL